MALSAEAGDRPCALGLRHPNEIVTTVYQLEIPGGYLHSFLDGDCLSHCKESQVTDKLSRPVQTHECRTPGIKSLGLVHTSPANHWRQTRPSTFSCPSFRAPGYSFRLGPAVQTLL